MPPSSPRTSSIRKWTLVFSPCKPGGTLNSNSGDEDQREFNLETRVITNENIIIPKMFHSCALNKQALGR